LRKRIETFLALPPALAQKDPAAFQAALDQIGQIEG
jgi:hypothetical protein